MELLLCHASHCGSEFREEGSEFYVTGSAAAPGLQKASRTSTVIQMLAEACVSVFGAEKARHLELRYLWVQERLRMRAFGDGKHDDG